MLPSYIGIIDCTRKWIGYAAYIVYVTYGHSTWENGSSHDLCFYSGPWWVSPYCFTQTGSEALLLVLQGKTIPYIKETFVLLAQAPDEGN